MQNTLPLSLIVTLGKDFKISQAQSFITEIASFFAKFQMPVEIVFVLKNDSIVEQLKSVPLVAVKTVIGKNIDRGAQLQIGLQAASGNYLIPMSLDLSTPLAEIYTLINELSQSNTTDIALGVRGIGKRKITGQRTKWHKVLEGILLEKLAGQGIQSQDLLSPFWIIRLSSWKKLEPNVKLSGWYYTPELILRALEHKMTISEVPISARLDENSQIPLIREYLRAIF